MITAEPTYRRIYWDTNILIHEKWPDVSAAMAQALSLGNSLKVEAVLLEPVERELEAHWRRDLLSAQGSFDHFRQMVKRVELQVPEVPLEDAIKAYRKTVDELVSKHGLVRRAPTYRGLEEVFGMAINHVKPFGEKGKNFQDVVICLAAIDDLANSGSRTGIFVSADGAFDQAVLNAHTSLLSIEFKLFRSVDDVLDYFKSHLLEAKQRAWEHSEQLAEKAVKASLPQIEEYITAELEIPAIAGVESVNTVKVASVEKVQTPNPESCSEGDRVTITARLVLLMMAEVRRYPSLVAPPKTLKVGEKRETSSIMYISTSTGVVTQEELPQTVNVELEATNRDENFVELKPTSVSLANEGFWGSLVEGAFRENQ